MPARCRAGAHVAPRHSVGRRRPENCRAVLTGAWRTVKVACERQPAGATRPRLYEQNIRPLTMFATISMSSDLIDAHARHGALRAGAAHNAQPLWCRLFGIDALHAVQREFREGFPGYLHLPGRRHSQMVADLSRPAGTWSLFHRLHNHRSARPSSGRPNVISATEFCLGGINRQLQFVAVIPGCGSPDGKIEGLKS